LLFFGWGAELGEALAGCTQPKPVDEIDWVLHAKLVSHQRDGTLMKEGLLWELCDDAAVKEELLLLATEPGGDIAEPVFCVKRTPALFQRMASMLFVGFAHNLLIESDVSKLANIQKIHKGLGAEMTDHLFMLKVRLSESKAARLQHTLRSSSKGGLREIAQENMMENKKLATTSSKAQHRLLGEQTEERGRTYKTEDIYRRGSAGLCQEKKRLRAQLVACRFRYHSMHVHTFLQGLELPHT
jgi:hypothetical protein